MSKWRKRVKKSTGEHLYGTLVLTSDVESLDRIASSSAFLVGRRHRRALGCKHGMELYPGLSHRVHITDMLAISGSKCLESNANHRSENSYVY
jgi:hypothetical protein